MVTKEQKMLLILSKKTSKELVASKLGISVRTLGRWIVGENKPPFSARRLITQIYNGHKSREQK